MTSFFYYIEPCPKILDYTLKWMKDYRETCQKFTQNCKKAEFLKDHAWSHLHCSACNILKFALATHFLKAKPKMSPFNEFPLIFIQFTLSAKQKNILAIAENYIRGKKNQL